MERYWSNNSSSVSQERFKGKSLMEVYPEVCSCIYIVWVNLTNTTLKKKQGHS